MAENRWKSDRLPIVRLKVKLTSDIKMAEKNACTENAQLCQMATARQTLAMQSKIQAAPKLNNERADFITRNAA